MLRKTALVVALAVFVGVIGARAQDKPADQFTDEMFVKTAASSGMHEVELGKIAADKAKNEDVKTFAQQLVKDHTKANEGLKTAAKAANIAVPDEMLEKHKKHVEMFRNYKGTNFDQDFLKHEVADHTEAVALFTRASKEAKNRELKDFATKTLPVLQQHLEQAKKLSK